MKLRRTGKLLKPGLFLLAGAIVNVAVAWGCAAYIVLRSADRVASSRTSDTAPSWLVGELSRGGHYRFSLQSLGTETHHHLFRSFPTAGPELMDELPYEARSVPDGCYQTCVLIRDDAGWPLLAVTGESINLRAPEVTRFAIRLEDAPQSATDTWPDRLLPYFPIWPGFAINTIFYAAILWLLFAAPRRVRRWRRIRRGLCPKCGYDLRGSPHTNPLQGGEGVKNYPECGSAWG